MNTQLLHATFTSAKVMRRDTRLAEEHGLCPHDTADEYVAAIEAWIAEEITELEMNTRLSNLKLCKRCRGRNLRVVWAEHMRGQS